MWWLSGCLAVALATCLALPVVQAEEDLPYQVVLDGERAAPADKETSVAESSGKVSAARPPRSKLTLPIPVGHEVKGIRVPYFDTYGAKQLDFFAEQARRVDEDVIRMTDAEIDFYNDQGGKDMKVFLPSAVLNLNTQMLGSDQPARIQRSDFILTGDKLVFHIPDKRGRLIGRVRMHVFDKEQIGSQKSSLP